MKSRNPEVEDRGFVRSTLRKTTGSAVCRFPPLVLSRSGSLNIEYLFEYGERSGIHYQRSA
jgi:hypothetical protein